MIHFLIILITEQCAIHSFTFSNFSLLSMTMSLLVLLLSFLRRKCFGFERAFLSTHKHCLRYTPCTSCSYSYYIVVAVALMLFFLHRECYEFERAFTIWRLFTLAHFPNVGSTCVHQDFPRCEQFYLKDCRQVMEF